MPEKEVDRREEIAIKFGLCKCDEAYTSRGLTAPDCPYHACAVYEAMDEYMKECCLELLEYMANNLVVCGHWSSPDGRLFKYKGELITKEQLFENFL